MNFKRSREPQRELSSDVITSITRCESAVLQYFVRLITEVDGRAAEAGLSPLTAVCAGIDSVLHTFTHVLDTEDTLTDVVTPEELYFSLIIDEHVTETHPEYLEVLAATRAAPGNAWLRDQVEAGLADVDRAFQVMIHSRDRG